MRLHSFIVIVLIICFCIGAYAQNNPSPDKDSKTIKLFYEKAYLQTDRTYYSTGEDLWFSAYLVNAKSTSLTASSANLYVELVNAQSAIIDKKIILMSNGLGHGDFKLKDSIPAGWYNIRAYTNWMRNFGDAFVFQKSIYLTNNLKENVSKSTRKPATTANNAAQVSKKSITFFPEGGALVDDLTNLVAFKTNDEFGNGLAATGSIIDSKGDTLTTFKTTDAGMGLFALVPKSGERYRVEGFFGKEKFSTTLPNTLKNGLVLHVTSDSLNIKASISANASQFTTLKGKNITLTIKHAGDNLYTGSLKMEKPTVSVSIPKKDFPEGIAAITLFDDLGRANCERLIFIENLNKISYTISPDKSSYKPREKVVLHVKAKNLFGLPAKTTFSLAAVDGQVPDDGLSIRSYLLLNAEIKGDIKNPDQYFDPLNPSRLKQLDLLLLTQGWRNYIWKTLADTAITISYLPEPALTIKGQVRERIGSKPLPNMNITLFGSGFKGDKLFSVKTDREGKYFIDGLKWYGNQPIKISSQTDKGKKGGWLQIDTLVKPISLRFKYGLDKVDNGLDDEMAKRMDYKRTYKFGDSINLDDVQIKAIKGKQVVLFGETLMTFGYPEQVFNITPDDYSYNGLEHFLLTKANGAFAIEDSTGTQGVQFLANGKMFRPRIVVNNRQDIQDRLDYYSINMDQINQVKIQHLIGNGTSRLDNGGATMDDVFVISLSLKDGALNGTNTHLLNVNLTGYYSAREFYSPNYSLPSSSNKDLRTTIYWMPKLQTNANGETSIVYYNSDQAGTVVIKSDGITEKGNAVSGKASYKVQ